MLALAAAFLHAGWNLLLARARDVQAATAVVLGISVVLFAPVAAVTWDVEWEVWPWALGSAAFELAYFALLAYAYERSELSVVYPVARGLAPVLVLAVGIASATAGEIAGVALVGAGVLLVRGLRQPEGRGVLFGALIAVCIAGYTLLDNRGIEHASAFAYFELVIGVPGARLSRSRSGDGAARRPCGRSSAGRRSRRRWRRRSRTSSSCSRSTAQRQLRSPRCARRAS